MVDLGEIQAAYYMVAATGVLVAAVFYIMNLREQRKNMRLTLENRRLGLVQNIMRDYANTDTQRTAFEIMNYEWKDYTDFDAKYGSSHDPEAAAKRWSTLCSFNNIGWMLRKGLLRIDEVYEITGPFFLNIWVKFKPVLDEIRERETGRKHLLDFDFLVGEMVEYVRVHDPSFKIPEALSGSFSKN